MHAHIDSIAGTRAELLSCTLLCPVHALLYKWMLVGVAGLDPLMAELIEKRVEGALQTS